MEFTSNVPAGSENVTLFTPSGATNPLRWASGKGCPSLPGDNLTPAADARAAALILPVFWYRHYVQDKGKFPSAMLEDLQVRGTPLIKAKAETKAGVLPYLTLAAGVAVVLLANYFFKL